jgi:hypothetical protein
MLRKLLFTALLVFFATAAFAGGQLDQEIPQMAQHIVDDGEGMSPEVLAALILGGLGLTGAIITALVTNRRRKG